MAVTNEEIKITVGSKAVRVRTDQIVVTLDRYSNIRSAKDIVQDEEHRFVTDVQITSWDAKEDASNKGAPGGYAELDAAGMVPWSQLPEVAFQNFTYTQAEASTIWDIVHPLDGFPSVFTVDENGRVMVGDVNYFSASRVLVFFSKPVVGAAYLS